MNKHIKYRANKIKYQDTCWVLGKPPSSLPALPLMQTSAATGALPLLLPSERAGSSRWGQEQTLVESQPPPRAVKSAAPAAVCAAQTCSTQPPARGLPWEAELVSAACCLGHRCCTVEQKQNLHFLD